MPNTGNPSHNVLSLLPPLPQWKYNNVVELLLSLSSFDVHLKNYDIFHNSFYKPAKSSDNPFSRFRQQLFTSLLFKLL